MFVDRYNLTPEALGIADLVTQPWLDATNSLERLDEAFNNVNSWRARAGAQESRLQMTEVALGTAIINITDAISRIVDADMAKEMMNLTAANIIEQAGLSILAQASRDPEVVLGLLNS